MSRAIRTIGIWFAALLVFGWPVTQIQAASPGVQESVSAISVSSPDDAHIGSNFDVDINVQAITGFKAYQFDLSYDSSVIQVLGPEGGSGVSEGQVGGSLIQVDGWGFIPAGSPSGTIRVLGRIPGNLDTIGSGYLARVHFGVLGTAGQISDLTLTNAKLFDLTTETIASSSSSSAINIIPPLPVITGITPASCEQGVTGFSVQISGSNLNGVTAVQIGSGVGISTNSFAATNSTMIGATISLANTAVLGAQDVVVSTSGGTAILPGAFTVLPATPPAISAISPVDNATGVAVNGPVTSVFTKDMLESTINSASFILKNGSITFTGTVTYNAAARMAVFTPAWNLGYNTVYTATVKKSVTDLGGNSLIADYSWSFTTREAPDTTPPAVIAVGPADNSVGVAVDGSVTASFSEPILESSLNTGSFILKNGATPVTGTISYNGAARIAVFAPASNLAYNTIYTATINTGVTDLAGNHLAADRIWNFTTGLAPDTTPPSVISVSPTDNATGVTIGSVVTAGFSEALLESTVGSATMILKNGDSPVSAVITYYADNQTAILTPVSLAYSTLYTATLKTGVTDLAGNHLAADRIWSFTTGPAPDMTPPSVVSVSPADNATGVAADAVVAVIFSEPLNPSSLNLAAFSVTNGAAGIDGTVTYNANIDSVTFTPAASLEPGTVYTVTLNPLITDLAGNPLAAPFSWSFTTAPPTEASVSISVLMQGSSRPESGWVVPLTLKLFEPGADVLSAAPLHIYHLTTARNGGTALAAIAGVPYGTYDVMVSSPHCLSNLKKAVVLSTPAFSIDMGTLLEGNADDNNVINIQDFGILASTYGKTAAQNGWDARADLDGNGVINIADFGLLVANYGKVSPVQVP